MILKDKRIRFERKKCEKEVGVGYNISEDFLPKFILKSRTIWGLSRKMRGCSEPLIGANLKRVDKMN